MKKHSLVFSALLLSVMTAPAMAQDKTPDSVVRKSEALTTDSPPSVKKWIDAENKMIDKLSEDDRERIFILRNKHSIIRVIDVVEGDVGNAVKACGNANPDMKDKMEARFSQWKDAVNPITETAQKNLKKEIDSLKAVSPKEFRSVLKLNDDAFRDADKRTVKNPVSSKSACNKLLASMDRTEDRMIKLLQDTLLPPSVIKTRAAREAKEAKPEKAEKPDSSKAKKTD